MFQKVALHCLVHWRPLKWIFCLWRNCIKLFLFGQTRQSLALQRSCDSWKSWE